MIAAKPNIIVTGTPGAWINAAMASLHEHGWHITWPNQDLSSMTAQKFLNQNNQNVVVQQIVNSICDQSEKNLFSLELPAFYSAPYPGPKEFIQEFEKRGATPILVAAIGLHLFLDLWVDFVDVVVDITASVRDDIRILNSLTNNVYTEKHLMKLRNYQINRYHESLRQFGRVFSMSNDEIKAKDFSNLLHYVNSGF